MNDRLFSVFLKFKINPFFWVVTFLGIITGHFRDIIMLFIVVFFHEAGHALAAQYFKWRIKKIELLPFGGVAEVDESGNKPFIEEFIVVIAGPLQHLWLIGLSFFLYEVNLIDLTLHELFLHYNLMVLLFNLFAIWPLDGGKLLFLLLALRFPFKKAHQLMLALSFLFLLSFMLINAFHLPLHLNLIIILSFLGIAHYLEWKQRRYKYIRFLMERMYQVAPLSSRCKKIFVSPEDKIDKILSLFQKGVEHKVIVKEQSKLFTYSEKELLQAFFYDKKVGYTIRDAFS